MGAIVIVGNMLAQPFVAQLAVGRSEDIKSELGGTFGGGERGTAV